MTIDVERTDLAVDHDELRMALVLLDITLNVDILFLPPSSGRAGEYLGVPDDRSSHQVRIHPDLDASTANRIAWHELAHAMQAERVHSKGGNFNEVYHQTMSASGIIDEDLHEGIQDVDLSRDEEALEMYRSTPFEFEADLMASRYAHDHAVIIPRTARAQA